MSDIFEEEILSPDKEEAPSGGDLLRVKSNEAMESILLESTPCGKTTGTDLEELPADGVKNINLEEKASDISQYFLAAEEPNDPFAELAPATEVDAVGTSVDPPEDLLSAPEEPPTEIPDIASSEVPDNTSTDPSLKELSSATTDETDTRSRGQTVRIRCTSESNREEAVPVPFEESKGEGLKFTQSTKNLTKYFVDSPPEADPEGKEFFDAFAAAADDEPAPSVSAPGTSLPPETPPIPSMHGTPFASLTSQISQDEKADGLTSIEATFQDAEDAFSASLQMSEAERRHDAWIPSEMTLQTLATLAAEPSTFIPEPSHLTMPGIVFADPLGDPVKDLMVKFMGEAAAAKRQTLDADSVPQDKNGLTALISAECYRAAIELTGRLLTACGQGAGKLQTPTKHSAYSLDLWFIRIGLLMKLRLYSHAEAEMQAFGNLDNPDLYYEFYPDLYPGRRGSMVSFDFRVIHAELPQYLGKTQESLDRLDYLHAIVKKMKSNLESGFGEDGSLLQFSDGSRLASRDLWHSREVRLLYSIVNCLLNIKDYATALNLSDTLLQYDKEREAELLSAMGRIYLQMGDMGTARQYFDRAEKKDTKKVSCVSALNKGFVALGNNQFNEAFNCFKRAVDVEPTNAVAINNMAVCALYQGKLKEALNVLESLVKNDPSKYLQEGVLFNLCTLYELESSRAMNKKQGLLDLVSQHKGNGFNVACLKMA